MRIDRIFNIYRDRFRITEIELITHSGFSDVAQYYFQANEAYPNGGLLLCRNYLCGFIDYANDKGEGRAIMPAAIRHFLRNKTYKKTKSPSAFISQGFRLRKLIDPVSRKYYSIPKGIQGAMVKQAFVGTSAWGVLQEKDILVAVAGYKIGWPRLL